MTISKASAVAVSIGASIAGSGPVAADSFFLEQGSISVAGQNLSITRLPITLTDGTVVYRDVVMRFKYVNGTIAFEYGFPKVTASVLPAPGPFVAGTYKLQGASNLYTLAGPYSGPNGRTRWVLSAKGTSHSAEFYTGPVTGHPLATRINNAKITAKYTFGYSTTWLDATDIGTDNLLAMDIQQGGVLYLYDYTNSIDRALPQYFYTLVKQ